MAFSEKRCNFTSENENRLKTVGNETSLYPVSVAGLPCCGQGADLPLPQPAAVHRRAVGNRQLYAVRQRRPDVARHYRRTQVLRRLHGEDPPLGCLFAQYPAQQYHPFPGRRPRRQPLDWYARRTRTYEPADGRVPHVPPAVRNSARGLYALCGQGRYAVGRH